MAAAMEQDMATYAKVHSETFQQAEIYTINEILLGTANIAMQYNDTIKQAQPGRNAAAWQLQKYQLEVGAVFSAGQILGYFQSAGMTPGPVNLNQPLELNCGVGGRQKAQVPSYPGLAVLLAARALPHGEWSSAFRLPAEKGVVADLDTMIDQIQDYGCSVSDVETLQAPTSEGAAAASWAVQSLNDAATCGYQLGLLQGETAMEVGVLTKACGGGRRKKKRGGRRKIMRGGALDENTQLNLLTTALILGGIGGGYALGAGAAVVSGFDFCYRQGRSILYALNWLKRPCISDASIISGLIFKSIPGLGSAAKTCLEVAQWNKVMNTALIGIVGTVYSTALALGLKTISGGSVISAPGQLFSVVKENVSRPVLRKLKSVGEYAYSGAIVSFRLVQDGVGTTNAAVQAAAAHIVALLQQSPDPSTCTIPATEEAAFATDQATVAAAVVATNDATTAITDGGDAVSRDGERIANISPEQETALQAVLANMSPADKAAFIEAVRLAVRISKENRARFNAMSAAGEKAFAETQGDEAAKQAAAADAFMRAFVAQDDPRAKKGIFALMDDQHKELVRQNAGQFQIDMSTLEGGRRRSRRKTRRHRNKKKKAKTMRKKKTRGRRKPKRKTKGKKSKARRKTRSYRR